MKYEELNEKRESGQDLTLLETIELLGLEMEKLGKSMEEATELLNQKGGWVYRI